MINKKLVVTTDFDETLFSLSDEKIGMLWAAVDVLIPIKKIHDLIHAKHKEGCIIDIVTSRACWGIEEVDAYILEYNLPIRKVHYTSGGSKVPILKKIMSTLHIDDNLAVGIDCKSNDIPFLLVDDGRHKNNTTAEFFERIKI
jgi:hypothetical protein